MHHGEAEGRAASDCETGRETVAGTARIVSLEPYDRSTSRSRHSDQRLAQSLMTAWCAASVSPPGGGHSQQPLPMRRSQL